MMDLDKEQVRQFLIETIEAGLDSIIMDPFDEDMMEIIEPYR